MKGLGERPINEVGESRVGIIGSFSQLLKTLVAIAGNRLELLLVELQEERWRLFEALLLVGIVLIFALITLLVPMITIIMLCVKADRLGWLVGLTLIDLAITVFCFWRLRALLRNWTPFSASLDEFKKDKACLDVKN
jgi:uncharacterized membrane protein YqjE